MAKKNNTKAIKQQIKASKAKIAKHMKKIKKLKKAMRKG